MGSVFEIKVSKCLNLDFLKVRTIIYYYNLYIDLCTISNQYFFCFYG